MIIKFVIVVFLGVAMTLSAMVREAVSQRMPTERPLSGIPFGLQVSLAPESPVPGKDLVISAQIDSQTAPHTRAVVSFYIDEKQVEQLTGVIPPYQAVSATYKWSAVPGSHTLKVELSSVLGVKYKSWEKT